MELQNLFEKYASDFKVKKDNGNMIPYDFRMDFQDFCKAIHTLQANTDQSKLLLADVSNLLPLDNCIVEWEKFIKQHNLKGNAGVMSVYFGMFLHGWRGRNSEGFWQ